MCSGAVNTVVHEILLSLMWSINISVVDWFQSYLKERRQHIQVEEIDPQIQTAFPKMASCLLFLFALFVNFVTNQLSLVYYMYVDDHQIYT